MFDFKSQMSRSPELLEHETEHDKGADCIRSNIEGSHHNIKRHCKQCGIG